MSYQIIRHFALFVNSTYNYVADPVKMKDLTPMTLFDPHDSTHDSRPP